MSYTDNLLHAHDVFDKRKDELIDDIVSSYPEDVREGVEKKLKNTVFIFDSTPDVSYKFFSYCDLSEEEKEKIKEIYLDFMKVKDKLTGKMNMAYYQFVCTALQIKPEEHLGLMDKLISLDFGAFARESQMASSEIEKRHFAKRQEAYLASCQALRLNPVTDPSIADLLVQSKQKGMVELREKLMDRTMFGRDIVQSIMEKNNKYVNSYQLSEILLNGSHHSSYVVRKGKDIPLIVSHVPVVLNAISGNSDLSLLYELRKAAETTEKGCGFDLEEDHTYKTFNELRLLEEAKEDERKYLRKHIFSPAFVIGDNETLESLLPFVSDFIRKNREELNSLASTSDVPGLEKTFGTEIRTLANEMELLSCGIEKFGLPVEKIKTDKVREKVRRIGQRKIDGFSKEEL